MCFCLCVCLVRNPVSRIGTWDVEKEYHNKSKNCWCFWFCYVFFSTSLVDRLCWKVGESHLKYFTVNAFCCWNLPVRVVATSSSYT